MVWLTVVYSSILKVLMIAFNHNKGINGEKIMTLTINRLDATILFILAAAHKKGIENLSRFELMKLVYLIEIESMKFLGHKFSDDVTFVRETNGPISYDIYRSTERLEAMKLINIDSQEGRPEYGYTRACHSLKGKLPELQFSDSEKLYLNSILDDYIGLAIKKLKEIAYKTEPMLEMLEEEKRKGVETLKGKKINFDAVTLDEDILAGMMS
jgi:uncharacterized phage-associated protein